MIVPMKKIWLLGVENERVQMVEKLRALGVLHPEFEPTPQPRDSVTLQELNTAIAALEHRNVHAPTIQATDNLAPTICRLLDEQKTAKSTIEFAEANLRFYEEWGVFSLELVRQLRNEGISISLHKIPTALKPESNENTAWILLKSTKQDSMWMQVTKLVPQFSAYECAMPELAVEDATSRKEMAESEIKRIDAELDRYTGALFELRQQLNELIQANRLADFAATLRTENPVVWVSGFIPAENTAKVEIEAQKNGWGFLISEPALDDEPPTLLRYPAWISPILPVLNAINILPGYREADAGSIFLIFFCLFFSILIGDAGYGLLFLLISLAVRFTKPKIDTKITGLLLLTSLGTMSWGLLTGTYFGFTETSLINPLKIDWLINPENMMLFCFGIGAMHLTLAHLWNAIALAPKPAALSQLGWIGLSWTMFFVAGNLVLGNVVPDFVSALAIGGVTLVGLFMTPPKLLKSEWYNHVMLPLSLVSNFVDVVSYLRLFAVSAASLAMGDAFNTMALKNGINDISSGIISAFILFAGHSLNIILGAMGVLVHGVRLNTLEFSSHLGVQWKGRAYAPFKKEIIT